MFLKFARTKKRHFLLSLFYKLDTFFPLSKERKLKLYLDLEWIFERLAHEKSFLVFKEHPVRNKSFQFLKSKLTKEFSVLDLGCNTGDLTYQISTCVKNVVGIDFNSAHIVKARKTYIQENIQFIHGEVIEYLQQNSQRFDVMILSHILEHIENPESFLVSCKKFFRYIYIEALALINAERPPMEAVSNAVMVVRSELDCRSAVAKLIKGARRTVLILSPTLDAALFSSPGCLTAISTFARRSRHARVQILVEDTKAIASDSHPLLELARRLPSKVMIRRLPEDAPLRSNFVVVDDRAIWTQPDRDAYLGWWNLNDRVEARRLTDQFSTLFERASDDPELRLITL